MATRIIGRIEITSREANLLLFALDKYLGVDSNGHLLSTEDHFTLEQSQSLRDRLFDAHQHHPDEE